MEIVPVTRKEKFIKAAIEGVPLSIDAIPRIEMYLAKISGDNVDLPDPITRIEKYLAVIAGMDVVLPSPVTRVEKYLAKIAGMDVETPDPVTRIEMLLDEWVESSGGVLKTVSGAVVSVSDALKKAIISLVVSLEPIQDLHGYANPWPAGGGKNKYKDTFDGWTKQTTYWTYPVSLSDGQWKLSANLRTGKTKVTGCAVAFARNGTDYGDFEDFVMALNTGGAVVSTSPVTIASGDSPKLAFYGTADGFAAVMDAYEIQLEAGNTATSYAPYENFCPISGFTGVNIQRTGKNIFDSGISNKLNTEFAMWAYNDVDIVDWFNTLPIGTYRIAFKCTISTLSTTTANNIYGAILANSASGNLTMRNNVSNPTQGAVYSLDGTLTIESSNVGKFTNFWWYCGRATQDNPDGCIFSEFQVSVGSTATAYEPYNGTSVEVAFGQTVYGGSPDVTNWVLTVDRAIVDLGGLSWSLYNTVFYTTVIGIEHGKQRIDILSDRYATANAESSLGDGSSWEDATIRGNSANGEYIYIKDTRYATATAFKTAMDGVYACIPLATPQTYQLTPTEPTEIEMLLGENTVWSENGDITLTYMADGNANDVEALNILLGNRYVNLGEPDEATDREALEILLGGR